MDRESIKARFDAKWKENEETGCWEWTASLFPNGYGQFQVRKAEGPAKLDKYAHRWAWRLNRGAIGEGMAVLHRCDNRKCVNPDHLFVGTKKDNAQDMKAKDRHLKGELNSNSKLTKRQVIAIHQLSSLGHTHKSISAILGCVSPTQVGRILIGERWEHIYEAIQTEKQLRNA